MIVTVRLFARAKDIVAADSIRIELPAGATVGELRRELAASHPALAVLLIHSALAVDDEFAGDQQRLTEHDDIALLPPVSGGRG